VAVKVLILDLDNTIYPVTSIGEELFRPLFQKIAASGAYQANLEDIKLDIMRKPFQKVATIYNFDEQLTTEGLELLQEVTCTMPMETFSDYLHLKKLPQRKFLVTAGFTRMQESKIRQLGIGGDFEEIHIVDPQGSDKSKKDVFREIVEEYGFNPAEVLVVGDDPNSELKAARELGLKAVLYDQVNFNPHYTGFPRIAVFSELKRFI
jgi:putative hydrolase of the HAD superfamily